MTTSKLIDTNNSGLFVRAACPNRRGKKKRPSTSIPTMTSAPCHNMVTRPVHESAPACGANAPKTNIIGTMAKSSNSNMAKADLPTAECVPDIGSTNAVEESANATPMPMAAVAPYPNRYRPAAIIRPAPNNCAAPTPNTKRRIFHNLRKDSSRPMENSNKIMPYSPMG